ncbi:hypothetical protein EVAR_58028_1 [Eumeta japonica]|uniref:Uncharacterized protein n=1 Tax=Eumeta variegata TaxID=151549 RepID=A0A4C1ZKF0_EUMVA|nr:hypothetical protein EVAR_58028_1 [Eumeta japonica]
MGEVPNPINRRLALALRRGFVSAGVIGDHSMAEKPSHMSICKHVPSAKVTFSRITQGALSAWRRPDNFPLNTCPKMVNCKLPTAADFDCNARKIKDSNSANFARL